ncbi:hypothetical protein GCM10028798_31440 [Humibacter antri]
MELTLVNPDPKYAPPPFQPSPGTGWLYLAAEVEPPTRAPFVRAHARRTALLKRLTALADGMAGQPGVLRASVFRAVLIPPADGEVARPARFDVAVVVETVSAETLQQVHREPAVAAMIAAMREASDHVLVMPAECARLIAPVEPTRDGLFLFNHFAAADGAADPEMAIALWEHLAAWYVTETGLTNSALLAPTETGDFVLVNHARFDTSLPSLAAAQFSKPTFRSFVRANLRAHHLVAMPALYRLA